MKKTLCICLAFILLLSQAAFAIRGGTEEIPKYKVIFVNEEDQTIPRAKLVNELSGVKVISLNSLNGKTSGELASADFVLFTETSVQGIDSSVVSEVVNNGGIVGIESDDASSALESLCGLIGEERDTTIVTNGVIEIGAYISKRGGKIVPGVITLGSVHLGESKSLSSSYCNEEFFDKVDVNNFLDHVFAAREQTPPEITTNSLRSAPADFDREFDDYTTFAYTEAAHNFSGSAYITQYVYDICTYTSGGTTYAISDVVSSISVDADEYSWVECYNTRMHANITDMSIIDQTYLNSNSSNSVSLSGGFSVNSGNVITGNANTSTTYSYSTNNQTITNDFAGPNIKNWNVDPTKNWVNASWSIEPGIRVKNSNANSHHSGAFTSIRKIEFYWAYMAGQGGKKVYSDPFEVGGYW